MSSGEMSRENQSALRGCCQVHSTALVLFLQLTLYGVAIADTILVEKDGSGDYTVIQDAIDAAAEGDSILVGPGRYDDFREFRFSPVGGVAAAIIGISTNDLTIVGVDSALVRVGPLALVEEVEGHQAHAIAVNHDLSGIQVEGLAFENCRIGAGVAGTASFDRCLFRGHSQLSMYMSESNGGRIDSCQFYDDGVFLDAADPIVGLVIQGCDFSDNGYLNAQGLDSLSVIDCTFGGIFVALQFASGTSGTVRNCTFRDNPNIHLVVTANSHAIVEECTFRGDSYASIKVTNSASMDLRASTLSSGTAMLIDALLEFPNLISVRDCDLMNAGGLTVSALGSAGTVFDLDFSNNYWGTTDTAQIDEWIHDTNDVNYDTARVIYEPIRMHSVPTIHRSIGSIKALFELPSATSADDNR